jgi:hypothetical protein
MSLVQEKIGRTPGNHFSHHADAFKLGLQTALKLKEPGPADEMMEAVMLQCVSLRCPGHNEHIPYTSAASACGRCPWCKKFLMQCVGCGHIRTDKNGWCKSCRKIFL